MIEKEKQQLICKIQHLSADAAVVLLSLDGDKIEVSKTTKVEWQSLGYALSLFAESNDGFAGAFERFFKGVCDEIVERREKSLKIDITTASGGIVS